MKKGFSLVELAIVFVIIGTLIGGILVGQSMVDAAKIQRFVGDLQKYEIAVINFRTKYGVYPGDAPGFIPPGNADGELGVYNGNTCAGTSGNWTIYSSDERKQVWGHLSQAKMLSRQYAAFSPCGGPHAGAPEDPLNKGLISPFTELSERASTFVPGYPAIMAHKYAGGNFALNFYLNAVQVIPVEKKMGVTDYDMDNPDPAIESKIGLVNIYGSQTCYSGPTEYKEESMVLCNDPDADIGALIYFVMPN